MKHAYNESDGAYRMSGDVPEGIEGLIVVERDIEKPANYILVNGELEERPDLAEYTAAMEALHADENMIIVTAVEFKLLFSSAERITLKKLRASDEVLEDFFDLIEDPQLSHVRLGLPSTQSAVAYCVEKLVDANKIDASEKQKRLSEILSGQLM